MHTRLKILTVAVCVTFFPVWPSLAKQGSDRWMEDAPKFEAGKHNRGEGREDRGKRLEDWLAREAPEVLEKLQRLREENPELGAKVLHGFMDNIFKQMRMMKGRQGGADAGKESLKQLMDLELTSVLLAEEYRKATEDGTRERVAKELRDTLHKCFDLKHSLQQKQVEHMEERLTRLKEMTARRAAQKEAILGAHYDRLTGKSSHLDW